MGEQSKIEWTDHTFNPWRGCTKIAAGCANCYADSQAKRNPKTLGIWGDQGTRVVASETMWREPLKWNAAAESRRLLHQRHPELEPYVRPRVFCASMADVFEGWNGPIHNHKGQQLFVSANAGGEFWTGYNLPMSGSDSRRLEHCNVTVADVRARLFALIDATPNLDWLLLTKRPENNPAMIPPYSFHACETGDCPHNLASECNTLAERQYRDNVWLGCSIANQADADRNIPLLLKCRDLAPVLFVSAEPLLGAVDFRQRCFAKNCDGECGWPSKFDLLGDNFSRSGACIDWVIVGGESGPHARPMHPDWARSLRDQCQSAGVPFFFKQWGEWAPSDPATDPGRLFQFVAGQRMSRVGKSAAGRLLDGREWSEFPQAIPAA